MTASFHALRAIVLWVIALAIISQLALFGEMILDKERFARALNGKLSLSFGVTAIALFVVQAVELWLTLRRRVGFTTEGVRHLQIAMIVITTLLLLGSFLVLPYFEADPRVAHERLRLECATLAQSALGLLFFSALSLSIFQSLEASPHPGAARLRQTLALIASAMIFILSAKALITLVSGGPLFQS
ncbi:MAG: hypothetical protein GX614_06005 [Sandaracinaceae bacterium]|nr:hypothetical protein [Sandaracinaceae bacterium]